MSDVTQLGAQRRHPATPPQPLRFDDIVRALTKVMDGCLSMPVGPTKVWKVDSKNFPAAANDPAEPGIIMNPKNI